MGRYFTVFNYLFFRFWCNRRLGTDDVSHIQEFLFKKQRQYN